MTNRQSGVTEFVATGLGPWAAIATVWGGLPARCFGWVGWPPGVREPAFGGRGRGWHGSAADSAPQPWVSGKTVAVAGL